MTNGWKFKFCAAQSRSRSDLLLSPGFNGAMPHTTRPQKITLGEMRALCGVALTAAA
jgi:hypothetical protein